ncbi:efflux RND transporter periplasmic adaptor subunit [soil metagenome]
MPVRSASRLRWSVAVVAGLLLVIGAGLYLTLRRPALAAPAGSKTPALTVTSVIPHQVTWPATLTASGAIAPWQEAIIGAQVGGYRLAEILVNVGDPVKRGQVLARFDAEMLHSEEAQLKAGLAQAEALAAQKDADLKRAGMLQKAGNLSEQEYLKDQTETATAQTQVDSARALLASKQLQLRYTDVVAPDDGTICARTATLGGVVPIGQELFRMIIKDRLEWRGEATASQLSQIAPGQAVQLKLPDGSSSKATVRALAPGLDSQSRMGLVYADVEPGTPRAGMYANGQIVVAEKPALVVPAASVVIRDGYSYVVKLDEQGDSPRVKLQVVTVGRRQGSEVEILKDLTEGEPIVAQGAGFLNDGDIVRVVPAAKTDESHH